MIREHEKQTPQGQIHNEVNKIKGRVPIFAVSATLFERDREVYLDAGFDGWVMKPINFQRVHLLLDGVLSVQARDACLYKPGVWEEGGWFEKLA